MNRPQVTAGLTEPECADCTFVERRRDLIVPRLFAPADVSVSGPRKRFAYEQRAEMIMRFERVKPRGAVRRQIHRHGVTLVLTFLRAATDQSSLSLSNNSAKAAGPCKPRMRCYAMDCSRALAQRIEAIRKQAVAATERAARAKDEDVRHAWLHLADAYNDLASILERNFKPQQRRRMRSS